jgi:sulfate/thiosulfate transport system ATP-binding protein
VNGHDLASADGQSAAVYVRPHLLDIHLAPGGGGSFPATITHINAAGPTVKVELASQWGDNVYVELDHERFRALHLEREAQVYLSARENKVFIYHI